MAAPVRNTVQIASAPTAEAARAAKSENKSSPEKFEHALKEARQKSDEAAIEPQTPSKPKQSDAKVQKAAAAKKSDQQSKLEAPPPDDAPKSPTVSEPVDVTALSIPQPELQSIVIEVSPEKPDESEVPLDAAAISTAEAPVAVPQLPLEQPLDQVDETAEPVKIPLALIRKATPSEPLNASAENTESTEEVRSGEVEFSQDESSGHEQAQARREPKFAPVRQETSALPVAKPPETPKTAVATKKHEIQGHEQDATSDESAVAVPDGATRQASPKPAGVLPDSTLFPTLESPHFKPIETASAPVSMPPAPSVPQPDEFAADNHARILSTIRGELMPGGGTMQIRLDPPELGVLQISVRMEDGVMSASFQTSSEQATKLLSHSLSQLKTVLETQGVSVERLHVEQAPRDHRSSNEQHHSQDGPRDNTSAHQEQRKEMLRRMWRRLAMGNDPLDLVA